MMRKAAEGDRKQNRRCGKEWKTLEDAAKDEDQQTTTGAYASDDSTLDTSVKRHWMI